MVARGPNHSVDLTTVVAGIRMASPVLTASGTFGYGDEIRDLVPSEGLGAVVTKTITRQPRPGNPPPRIAEVSSGMLNTIGLQNVGLDRFLNEKWDSLRALPVPVIVSIAGATPDDYAETVAGIDSAGGAAGIELNLSCPNLQKQIICQNEQLVQDIIRRVKQVTSLPVVAKLSPMVLDIGGLAAKAESAGADGLSLVNTFPGMAVDTVTWRPKLSTVTGGMSGPAVKPLALRCVWEACRRVSVPVIGGGGIMTGEDAVEFLLAGAAAVSVGTANFVDPAAPVTVAQGLADYLTRRGLTAPADLVGRLEL